MKMISHDVKPAPSLMMETELTTTQGGGGGGTGGGGDGSRWTFSGLVFSPTWAISVGIVTLVVGVSITCVFAAKRRVWRRPPLPAREKPAVCDKLSMVAESHLSTSKADRALLRERLRVVSERHPHFRDLTAANNASSEVEEEGGGGKEDGEGGGGEEAGGGQEKKEERKGESMEEEEEEDVDIFEKELAEALVESRRLAREDLMGTRTSSSDLRNALQSMREKLAAADETEGTLGMQKEFLEEMEALAEANIGVAIMFGDADIEMVELHALMAKSFWEQCEKSTREAKEIKDEESKHLAAILQSEPGDGLPEGSAVEQLIAAVEVEREKDAWAVQTLVRKATEDIVASISRAQGYEGRCAAAERSLKLNNKFNIEFKKVGEAVLSEMREYITRAPGLIRDIGEAKHAIAAANTRINDLARKERKLASELEEQ